MKRSELPSVSLDMTRNGIRRINEDCPAVGIDVTVYLSPEDDETSNLKIIKAIDEGIKCIANKLAERSD